MAKVSKKIRIKNPQGLHARPAAQFVKTAHKFSSEIFLKKDDQLVDAKSIINILSLALEKDIEIELSAKGDDAQQAIEELRKILEDEQGY